MAKDKKLVKISHHVMKILHSWYTDVVREAQLCDYSSVKGCLNYLQMICDLGTDQSRS